MTVATRGLQDYQQYHALALLQGIQEWLDTVESDEEALAVVEIIEGVFRDPSDVESRYIGLAVQARFGVHLLGLDADTLAVRRRDLENSLVLIDSSTLVPWLARGSAGSPATALLMERLKASGLVVASTSLLIEELAEHARWAQKQIDASGAYQTPNVLEMATGRAGAKSNAFLEGFLRGTVEPGGASRLDDYISSCFGLPSVSNPLKDEEVLVGLKAMGLKILDLSQVDSDSARTDAESYLTAIRDKRRKAKTYTHDRQVQAEAEALALVEWARGGVDSAVGTFSNAYFISFTSMLNQVSSLSTPVTMRPEAALHWLATVRPLHESEAAALHHELMWELQARRMDLVDTASLSRAFGPLISASRERLEEQIANNQELTAQIYGDGAVERIKSAPSLQLPVLLESVLYDRLGHLEEALEDRESELRAMQEELKAAEADRTELSKLKERAAGRRKYERRKENSEQKSKRKRRGGRQ